MQNTFSVLQFQIVIVDRLISQIHHVSNVSHYQKTHSSDSPCSMNPLKSSLHPLAYHSLPRQNRRNYVLINVTPSGLNMASDERLGQNTQKSSSRPDSRGRCNMSMRQSWVGTGSSSSQSSRFHGLLYPLKSFQLTRSPPLKHRLTRVRDSRRRDLCEYDNQESAE